MNLTPVHYTPSRRHLRSKHRKDDSTPHKCGKCKQGFATKELREDHYKTQCDYAPEKTPEEGDPDDGMTVEIEERLFSRKKDRITNWHHLYRVLLPNAHPVPSSGMPRSSAATYLPISPGWMTPGPITPSQENIELTLLPGTYLIQSSSPPTRRA